MTTGRRAGFGRLADGRTVTWSLADGRHGRRWRSSTTDPGGILESALLLELDPTGRLSKVELATAGGLLSLHPEGALLHGNAVGKGGVRHHRLAWSGDHVLVVEDSLITLVAAALQAAPAGAGEWRTVPAVVVRSHLVVEPGEFTFEQRALNSIGLDIGGRRHVIELDELGVPAELRSGGGWPLELE